MGTFTTEDGSVYKGIFLQNKMESYCHFTNSKGDVWAGEMKNSLWDGAVTQHTIDGFYDIPVSHNLMMVRGKETTKKTKVGLYG